jgi:hypothetical protein
MIFEKIQKKLGFNYSNHTTLDLVILLFAMTMYLLFKHDTIYDQLCLFITIKLISTTYILKQYNAIKTD